MFSTTLAEPQETGLRFLVADERPFERRLMTDALRSLGRASIDYASTVEECVSYLRIGPPDVLFVDWEFASNTGLDLVRQIRGGQAGDGCRKLPIVMLAEHRRQRDVNAARHAGVDEFVVRPFSVLTVQKRIKSIQLKQAYAEGRGPNDDSPEVQIRKGLVRMYVERLMAMLAALSPDGDAREFKLTCAQLNVLANDLKEPLLISGTFSLSNYIRAVGGGQMNRSVVEAHLQAILQLAELPNCAYEIRRTVTSELEKLVAKKLGRAA